MRVERDPRDRRYRERLAGSYLASLLFHMLLALALFSVIANSSQEGATESQIGGSLVTLEQRAPVVAQVPVKAQQAAPVPHAPRVAPVAHPHAARPAHQPLPPMHHELSKFSPTAPPNPTPLPQATPEPNAQPTQAVVEPSPRMELPAVPTSAPSVATVAVAITMPPTAAPSPVPTAVPTAQPSPRPPAPTAAPTAKPQTPVPAAPTAAPTATAVAAVRASVAPSASPAAAASASAAPAATPGVASPSPTKGPSLAQTHGTAPSPGPTGLGTPGPRPGTSGAQRAGPERPVSVRPTPSAPPYPRGSAGTAKSGPPDINAKLRAMLPHNEVNPTEQSYHPGVALNGTMEPTPPPEILALTKFIYEENSSGSDAHIKMWVTNVRKEGPATVCEGWMLRYPPATQQSPQIGTASNPISGSVVVSVGAKHVGTLAPIVEEHATALCNGRHLVPFAPSPGSSP